MYIYNRSLVILRSLLINFPRKYFCHSDKHRLTAGGMVLCWALKAHKAFRPAGWPGCKTKKNRAVATATGRQSFTVFSNKVFDINSASSMSGNMVAELKPTVLRWGKCKRGRMNIQAAFLLLSSASSQTLTPCEKGVVKNARERKAFWRFNQKIAEVWVAGAISVSPWQQELGNKKEMPITVSTYRVV